jgi:hypothetical protein
MQCVKRFLKPLNDDSANEPTSGHCIWHDGQVVRRVCQFPIYLNQSIPNCRNAIVASAAQVRLVIAVSV